MHAPKERPLRARGEPHLSPLNASAAPRYWDGRVRKVVSVRFARVVRDRGSPDRFETLSCGHELAPRFSALGMCGGEDRQWRVCFECPGMAEALP